MGPEIFFAFFAFIGLLFWMFLRAIWSVFKMILNLIFIPYMHLSNVIRVRFWGLPKKNIKIKIFDKSFL